MEKALKLAFSEGFMPKMIDYYLKMDTMYMEENLKISRSECLINPYFWICLGKSLGWNLRSYSEVIGFKSYFTADDFKPTLVEGWQYHWHRFIDHIAEGKPIDDFFNSLIK